MRLQHGKWDFWAGQKAMEKSAQKNLLPSDVRAASMITDPSHYDQNSLSSILLASKASTFENRLTGIFSHAFGKDYTKVFEKSDKTKNWTREKINYELYQVIVNPEYLEQRKPHWVDTSVIGGRPAGLIFNNQR